MRPDDGHHHPDDPRRAVSLIKTQNAELQLDHKSFANSSPSNSNASAGNPPRRRPIIIYTHPPRVYRTTPAEFKTLVQRLTGKPRPSDGQSTASSSPPQASKKAKLCAASTDPSHGAPEYNCGFVGAGSGGFAHPSSVTVTSSAAHLETPPPSNSFAVEFSHSILEEDLYFGCNDSSPFWVPDRSSDDGTLSYDCGNDHARPSSMSF